MRGHRSQTWGPPAPPLASLGGSHCIHPPRLLCLWGISPPNQRFGKNTTVIVNVFLGGGMPGISNDGKIISPVDKQAVSGVPGKQTWQCPGPGKPGVLPASRSSYHVKPKKPFLWDAVVLPHIRAGKKKRLTWQRLIFYYKCQSWGGKKTTTRASNHIVQRIREENIILVESWDIL